ncbi:MAG TPA: basic amino acid ABC transporter substrate-binding protein [Syntrophomonadaceae bacterium]|nr:basic amino acid ABC transporter substrate-binding protein [Syntrophomonadaceae bacterium]
MNKLVKLLLASMLIIGLMFSAVGCGNSDEPNEADNNKVKKIVAGSETTFPPFEFDENGEKVGFDMDIIKAIGEVQGYEVEIMYQAFDSLIPALQSNHIDCAISAMSITPERQEAVDFSEPYFNAGLIIAVLADEENITTMDDLVGKKMSAQIGTIGAAAATGLKEKDASTEVRTFQTVGEAFMELEKGSVDAVINDHPVTDYYIKTTAKDTVKMVGEIFSADDQYGIAIKKGNTEIKDVIDEGLAKIRENGTYDQIYNKWFTVE